MSDIIGPHPSMDVGGFRCFGAALTRSTCYLEYGSGGSTVYACTVAQVKTIISVETDRAWTDKVRATLDGRSSSLFMEHCDIGAVREWGMPINNDRFANFWKYMVLPWEIAKRHNLVPDTVLIDGRFRVASFLYSLISARAGTVILFDDYFDRPEYFVAEQFCRVSERHERMALFVAAQNYSHQDIAARIAEYSVIWR